MDVEKIREELVKAQFTQMVDAIKATRERIHQLTVSAIVGLPAVILFAKGALPSSLELAGNALLVMSPLILLAFYLFYLSESSAIKRYGLYISDVFDPLMRAGSSSIEGWATYLNVNKKRISSQYPEYDLKHYGMTIVVLVYMAAAVIGSSVVIASLPFASPTAKSEQHQLVFFLLAVLTCGGEVALIVGAYRYRWGLTSWMDGVLERESRRSPSPSSL